MQPTYYAPPSRVAPTQRSARLWAALGGTVLLYFVFSVSLARAWSSWSTPQGAEIREVTAVLASARSHCYKLTCSLDMNLEAQPELRGRADGTVTLTLSDERVPGGMAGMLAIEDHLVPGQSYTFGVTGHEIWNLRQGAHTVLGFGDATVASWDTRNKIPERWALVSLLFVPLFASAGVAAFAGSRRPIATPMRAHAA